MHPNGRVRKPGASTSGACHMLHRHANSGCYYLSARRASTGPPQQCPTNTVHGHNTRATSERANDEENRGRRPLHCFMNIICTIAPCSP
ncbi:hypothetical protein X777_14611 [Ooceraea biroi]|uniref:Uncharacterized protein n=1 Tax=Ooceraea biroi TaxID=2015173 RepID=A0A026WWY5_OOCBI|nr:hypothetical protein X777_14611 [Ooceraea biroi]